VACRVKRAEKGNLPCRLEPVWITAGHGVNQTDEGWFVPKVELAATVHLLLQTSRLQIPRSLQEAEILGRELEAFRVRVTAAGNEELAADWRSRAHDDEVLALAIALWLAENGPRPMTQADLEMMRGWQPPPSPNRPFTSRGRPAGGHRAWGYNGNDWARRDRPRGPQFPRDFGS
jgi:hypothetical protein